MYVFILSLLRNKTYQNRRPSVVHALVKLRRGLEPTGENVPCMPNPSIHESKGPHEFAYVVAEIETRSLLT
jgi:hypothetical protein